MSDRRSRRNLSARQALKERAKAARRELRHVLSPSRRELRLEGES
jgi:hypothetical protein